MSLLDELVLADDVELFPVADLAPAMQSAIPHSPGDFALSRSRTRDTSRVIDASSRDLLREFERPTLVVDAVIRFASSKGLDPETTFDAAYAMLDRLYRANILIGAAAKPKPLESDARPGLVVFGFTLGHVVHEMADTVVFFARDPPGRAAAVKILRGDVARAQSEASAMRRAGPRAPEVYAVGEWEGSGVLVCEWVFGDEVTRRAAGLRGHGGARSEAGLLTLVSEVARAFAEVHVAGVLHGDVHPGNVLVEKEGRIRIVDFGLSGETESDPAPPRRGGLAFFFEPELAAANLKKRTVPLTVRGEQYAVGALVYLLWTGVHYVDWSLEPTAMMTQIAKARMVPFARRRVAAWPALEAVLQRSLAKRPAARFPSCAVLAGKLGALLPEARRRDAARRPPRAERDSGRSRVEEFLDRSGLDGPALDDDPGEAPHASVQYGAAGIAYALYKIALARGDARLLATSDVWGGRALRLAGGEKGFYAPDLEITEQTVGKASLFHSPTGVHGVRALVALASGDPPFAASAIAEFVAATRAPCEEDDLTLGKAGLLVGTAEVLEAAQGALGCDTSTLEERGTELALVLERVMNGSAAATSTSMRYLGFAHGWAGLLFAQLRWCQATGRSAESLRGKLDELGALREPDGSGLRWPVANRTVLERGAMDGFCHGPAGHTLLWALAHELLGGGSYGAYAEQAATTAWASDIENGSLCCGLAGIGYACAAAHRVTGDAVWLERARRAAARALDDRSQGGHPDSLYKGALGAVLLWEEIERRCPATPFVERGP